LLLCNNNKKQKTETVATKNNIKTDCFIFWGIIYLCPEVGDVSDATLPTFVDLPVIPQKNNLS
jgi:hypothetical protein